MADNITSVISLLMKVVGKDSADQQIKDTVKQAESVKAAAQESADKIANIPRAVKGAMAGSTESLRQVKDGVGEVAKSFNAIPVAARLAGLAIGGVAAAVAAIGAAAVGAAYAIDKTLDKLARYTDLAKFRDIDPAGLASLQVAANLAGVKIESVADSIDNMQRQLLYGGKRGSDLGKALESINIDVEQFKRLKGDEQYKLLAQRMSETEDTAGKLQLVQRLLSGDARQHLRVMDEYIATMGRQTSATAEQLRIADAYDEMQKQFARDQEVHASKMRAAWQSLAVSAGPAFQSMREAVHLLETGFYDLVESFIGVKDGMNGLERNEAIRRFAERIGEWTARAIDWMRSVAEVARQVVAEIDTTLSQGDRFTGRVAGQTLAGQQFLMDMIKSGPIAASKNLIENLSKVDKQFEKTGEAAKKAYKEMGGTAEFDENAALKRFRATLEGLKSASEPRELVSARTTRTALSPQEAAAARLAAQEAQRISDEQFRERLTSEQQRTAALMRIDDAYYDAKIDAATNAERILMAKRSADLIGEQKFYAERRRLLEERSEDERAQLLARQALLEAEQSSIKGTAVGVKQTADERRRLADISDDLVKIEKEIRKNRDELLTKTQELGIQEEAAARRAQIAAQQRVQAWKDAQQAAADYLKELRDANALELETYKLGTRAQQRAKELADIQIKGAREVARLIRERDAVAAQTVGPLPEEQQRLAEEERQRYNKLIALAQQTTKEETDIQASKYEQLDRLQSDWAQGASRGLNNYLDTVKNVADSTAQAWEGAMQRMEDSIVDGVMTGKLSFKSLIDFIIAEMLRAQVRQALGGFGGFLTDLLGLGGFNYSSRSPIPNFGTAGLIPGVASGGPVTGGSTYWVGERGPELFVPNASGTIIPNEKATGQTVNITTNVASGVSRSEMVAALKVASTATEQRIMRTLKAAKVVA